MRRMLTATAVAGFVAYLTGPALAGEYPLTLTAEAKTNTGTTAATSTVTIRVDRLMEENRRKRVTDALRYSGYLNFVPALRALPAVGAIELGGRAVEIRYAHEQQEGSGRRLVIVADRPLFFLGGDPAKSRAGYELTIVELHFGAHGAVTGTMAGAARVKPSPAGIVLDAYADVLVHLTARVPAP
jgi:hypothetical protein